MSDSESAISLSGSDMERDLFPDSAAESETRYSLPPQQESESEESYLSVHGDTTDDKSDLDGFLSDTEDNKLWSGVEDPDWLPV